MKKRNAQKKAAHTRRSRESFAENSLLDLSTLSGIPIWELLVDAFSEKKKKKVAPKKKKKVTPKKEKIPAREPATGRFKKSPKSAEQIPEEKPPEGYRVYSIFEEPQGGNEPIEFGNFDGPNQDTNDYFDELFDDLDVDSDENDEDIGYGDSTKL